MFNHPCCVGGAPVWEVESADDVTIHAAPMSHGIPCVGYVVQEQVKSGKLQPDVLMPLLRRNFEALKTSGIRDPNKVLAIIKELPIGSSYTFPDGSVVQQSDVVAPPREGRKVVICGDTTDARAIAGENEYFSDRTRIYGFLVTHFHNLFYGRLAIRRISARSRSSYPRSDERIFSRE